MQYRPRYLVSTAIVLVLGQVIAPSTTIVRASESCETLRDWAALTYTDKSPTLAELTAFDGSRQRAIFSALAPAARVSVWREHLDALSKRPEFSPAQRAAAAELRAVVVPEIYTRGSAARERALTAWKEREALFPDRGQRRAFLVLGASPVVAAGLTDWCDCEATYGQVQCYPLVCGPPAGCALMDGCGFSGLLECDRRCQ